LNDRIIEPRTENRHLRRLEVLAGTAKCAASLIAKKRHCRERLFKYFKELEENSFISYKCGDHIIKRVVERDPSVVAHRTKRTEAKPYGRIDVPCEEISANR